MTRLERYMARELIPTFVVGAALYVSLLLFIALAGRAQWLGFISPQGLGGWLLYQVPHNAVQAFPLAMVFAVLISFGRLARDNEILAAQAGGVGLARLVRPIVWFALVLVALALFLAQFVVPNSNERVSIAWWDNADGGGKALSRIVGKRLLIGDLELHAAGFDATTQELRDVRLSAWTGKTQTVFFARAARYEGSTITLLDVVQYGLDYSALPLPDNASRQDLERVFTVANSAKKLTYRLAQTRDRTIATEGDDGFDDVKSISEYWQAYQSATNPFVRRSSGVQVGMKTAVPFANLIILLLVVPLAASSSRSVGMSFGLAALVTVAYYVALSVGQLLGNAGVLPPFLGPWLPNLLFIAFGMWWVRRGVMR